MRLCRVLACTLQELDARMSLDEFYLWQQFEAEWPMQDLRSDFHSAQITQSVVNMAGKAIKDPVTLGSRLLFTPIDEKPAPPAAVNPLNFFKGK